MRTVTVVMTYMLGAASLASLALAGCSKDPAGGTVDPGREAVILSIAEANYGVSGGARRSGTSAANGGAPQTRAIVGGNGSTFFTDRDRLGLFLRGDGYEDVDNRIVQLDYPGEGPQKKWNITGEAIPLYADAATVTAYFPYSDAFGLTMSAIPLSSGPYDVNSNDVVWQRDTVHAAHTQAMFLEMQHAMTRVKIRLSGGRKSIKVGDLNGGGVVYWVNPDDENDFRVVALDQSQLMWGASNSYVLGSGAQDQTARNGADIWKSAKASSEGKLSGESGVFATDYPAFSYCYEKTDGDVEKGTWYLPSLQELKDLYSAKGSVESVITTNGGMAFSGEFLWSATERSESTSFARYVYFANGSVAYYYKNYNVYFARCIRHLLASDVSDPGDYTGAGKITGVRIADAGDVASEARVVYLDGTLDLTQATPVVTPGWPDAVADKSEKTLTAEGVLYDLLLLPVDKIDAGKVLLEVELDGKVLSVPFPVDAVDKWEAGKAYTYEVLVRNGGAQVVFGKATVTPWNYGGSISGDLDTSKPEYGGGDVQDWGDNEWETPTGKKLSVGDRYDGDLVYWVNPDDPNDFLVVASSSLESEWAASTDFSLWDKSSEISGGKKLYEVAKAASESRVQGQCGDFSHDYPGIYFCGSEYCLPSRDELKKFDDALDDPTFCGILSDIWGMNFHLDAFPCCTWELESRNNVWSRRCDTANSSLGSGVESATPIDYRYQIVCVKHFKLWADGPVTGEITDASPVSPPPG